MFLRIDKINELVASNDSLHACLATAHATIAVLPPDAAASAAAGGGEEEGGGGEGPNLILPDDTANATGELFVVGRKNAAVTLDDKVRHYY